ncbi:hypothetical protein LCGC14_0610730 [marine sediment metagenome]|uniref:Uncharacterized protein n=1 Tax=marine sediment metagenome TaxID=412755 RepID=A0A0F9UG94_9ZZZZ
MNQGICEIRVHINYNLSNIETELKNLTHLRLNMPNLQTLPKFIDTLTQMSQLLITSTKFDNLTNEFGTDENKYRLEIRTNRNLDLNDSIGELKEITHLRIKNINFIRDFNIISNLTNLTHLRIVHGNLTGIPEFIESLPFIKHLHIYSQGDNPFRAKFWSTKNKGRFEFQTSNNKFTLQNMKNITHLRISGHSNINFNDEELEYLKCLRIDNINQIPSCIQKMKNLAFLELDINNVRMIPDWFSQFANIRQLVIKTERIEFSDNFWKIESLECLKIRVHPNFNNIDFIRYFKNLSHLWIETPDLIDLPNVIDEFIKNNINLKIYKDTEIKEDLNKYLKSQAPNFFILKIHSNCIIPDNLKIYEIKN